MDTQAALDSFVASLRARGSGQTLSRYTRACTSLVEQLDGKPLRALTRHDVQWALASLHAGGLSPRTLAVTLSAWRTWFRHLAKIGEADPAIFSGIKALRAPKRLPNALTESEAMQLVDAPASAAEPHSPAIAARDQAMFEVLYGCGIRIGELVGLDIRDADLDRGEIRVFGKGQKERLVPLGAPACVAIRSWLALRPSLVIDTTLSALFVGARGDRVSPPVVRRALKMRALQQGITSHVYPHRLRHSFASHVLQSSQDLRAVQELMGHASIASTQVYTHLEFQHLAKVYDQAHPRARKRKT